MCINPVFFGDDAYARRPGKKSVTIQLPKLDPKKPLNALLAGPEVIAGLTKAMIVYLIDNPKDLPAVNLGII